MFTAKVVNKHWILCIGQQNHKLVAKLLSFGKNHEWQFAHISSDGDFVLVNALKELFLIQWDPTASHFKLGHRIILPKGITHGFSQNQRLYWFDRAGDIYSQSYERLKSLINNEETRNEICHDMLLETSNFCAILDLTSGNLLGHEVVAFSDQYYKIRLIEKKDFHRMLMTISLRTRYAESLFIYKKTRLLVYYDDSKMQLLDEKEILHSLNQDTNYVTHPFVGHLKFHELPNSNHILVHCLDTDEVHVCELNVDDLKLTSLTKQSFHGEGISQSELQFVDQHGGFIVKVPKTMVDPEKEFKEVVELLGEKIDIL